MITVLSVAYPFAPVGPDAVGGAEQILSAVEHAVVAAGHRSLVIAAEGSRTAGTLLPVPRPEIPIDDPARQAVHASLRRTLGQAMREADIIHMHGIDFDACLPPPGKPVLVTLHLPLGWYPASALRPGRPDTWLHCVSASQHATCPPDVKLLPCIPNGVPLETLTPSPRPGHAYALMLGRICPEKGQHLGLRAAHAAGVTALLAGDVFPYAAHQDYFAHAVQPLLDRRRRFLGPVGVPRKRRLLAAARCLLVPSLAAETSCLVAMEALACGTPVIAFRAGALPDLIEHGRTGFLVGDEREMAEAIALTPSLDRAACRHAAETRFPAHRMTGAYLRLYEQLLSSAPLASAPLACA